MHTAYINRIETAVPAFDVHAKFIAYAPRGLKSDRDRKLFRAMAQRSGIEHRYSVLPPHADENRLDSADFYQPGCFPDTAQRMQLYEAQAFPLARAALGRLAPPPEVTHVIVTSCTGFYAPGLDIDIVRHYGLSPGVERTIIGFMGCYAAFNALKLARHIVRSAPEAKVLVVNLELCTLHLQQPGGLEQALSFLIFSDGCAACLVSAEPEGLELGEFHSLLVPDSAGEITWRIGQQGFDMFLSGQVPRTVTRGLRAGFPALAGGLTPGSIAHWAVHPGGRSILDAVQSSLNLGGEALAVSRNVLRRFGNMSSAAVMFALKEILDGGGAVGLPGCALSFGPGVTAESMIFRKTAAG